MTRQRPFVGSVFVTRTTHRGRLALLSAVPLALALANCAPAPGDTGATFQAQRVLPDRVSLVGAFQTPVTRGQLDVVALDARGAELGPHAVVAVQASATSPLRLLVPASVEQSERAVALSVRLDVRDATTPSTPATPAMTWRVPIATPQERAVGEACDAFQDRCAAGAVCRSTGRSGEVCDPVAAAAPLEGAMEVLREGDVVRLQGAAFDNLYTRGSELVGLEWRPLARDGVARVWAGLAETDRTLDAVALGDAEAIEVRAIARVSAYRETVRVVGAVARVAVRVIVPGAAGSACGYDTTPCAEGLSCAAVAEGGTTCQARTDACLQALEGTLPAPAPGATARVELSFSGSTACVQFCDNGGRGQSVSNYWHFTAPRAGRYTFAATSYGGLPPFAITTGCAAYADLNEECPVVSADESVQRLTREFRAGERVDLVSMLGVPYIEITAEP